MIVVPRIVANSLVVWTWRCVALMIPPADDLLFFIARYAYPNLPVTPL